MRNWSAASGCFGVTGSGFGANGLLSILLQSRFLSQRQRFFSRHACRRIFEQNRSTAIPPKAPTKRTAISRCGFSIKPIISGGMPVILLDAGSCNKPRLTRKHQGAERLTLRLELRANQLQHTPARVRVPGREACWCGLLASAGPVAGSVGGAAALFSAEMPPPG